MSQFCGNGYTSEINWKNGKVVKNSWLLFLAYILHNPLLLFFFSDQWNIVSGSLTCSDRTLKRLSLHEPLFNTVLCFLLISFKLLVWKIKKYQGNIMGAILMRIKVESFSLPKHRFEPNIKNSWDSKPVNFMKVL